MGACQSLSTAPGSSLVSVCQRSIRLSLFFRQSNQCFRRSPLALMPRTTPPTRGELRGQPGAGGAGPPTGPSPGRPPPLPRFHALRPDPPPYPPGSEGGQCSDRHPTLLVPQIRAWGSCSSSTWDQSSTGAECSGVLGDKGWRQTRARKGQGSSTVHSPQVYQGLRPQGLGVQPEALTITTSHACSTDCWVTLQASFPL